VTRIDLEVRRLDLVRWLNERQGRLDEATLPESGALVAARTFTVEAPDPFQRWRPPADAPESRLTLAPGTYVLTATATTRDGRRIVRRRLLIASALRAAVFVGRQHALLWVVGSGGSEARARFWMRGTIVPSEVTFDGDIARFALPPEARLLRDGRWVCVVEAGGQAAVCAGSLPETARAASPPPSVALLSAPTRLRPGQTLQVFGLIPEVGFRRPTPAGPRSVELQLLDSADTVRGRLRAALRPDGSFFGWFRIGRDLAGEGLRVVARLDGRVLPNLRVPSRAVIGPSEPPNFSVRITAPQRLDCEAAVLRAEVVARTTWGAPLADARLTAVLRAVALPQGNPPQRTVAASPQDFVDALDSSGRWRLEVPLKGLDLPADRPIAARLDVEVSGWDGRTVAAHHELLIGPEPAAVWVESASWSVSAGQPVVLRVGWFDPQGLAAGPPTLEVRREGSVVRRLALYGMPDGLHSEPWVPSQPGQFDLVATLPLMGSRRVEAQATMQVTAASGAPGDANLTVRAVRRRDSDTTTVEVRLGPRTTAPLLVLLEDGDPLDARSIEPFESQRLVRFRMDHGLPETTRVLVARFAGPRLEVGETAPVRESVTPLGVRVAGGDPRPGETVRVEVETSSPAPTLLTDTLLVARLIKAARGAGVPWVPSEGFWPLHERTTRLAVAATTAQGVSWPPHATANLDRDAIRTLFEGRTVWLEDRWPLRDATSLRVPLPHEPEKYELLVALRDRQGTLAAGRLTLDTREAIVADLDVPGTLRLGDRVVAGVRIANPTPVPQSLHVLLKADATLHPVDARSGDRSFAPRGDSTQVEVPLEVPARAEAFVSLRAEAARTGLGLLCCEVRRAGVLLDRITRRYRVRPVAESAATEPAGSSSRLRVRRAVYVLEPAPDAEGRVGREGRDVVAALDDPDRILRLQRSRVAPGERVQPGQILLVEEQFTLDTSLNNVTWEQALPANARTLRGTPRALRRIGFVTDKRVGRLVFVADHLEAGRYVHEYVVVPVRPGACLLPLPTVRSDSGALAIEVEPAEVLLLASETTKP